MYTLTVMNGNNKRVYTRLTLTKVVNIVASITGLNHVHLKNSISHHKYTNFRKDHIALMIEQV